MTPLHVSRRELAGLKLSQLRKQGFIPLGLVERTHQTLPLKMAAIEFRRAMSHGAHTHIEVLIEGETTPRQAIIKQIEIDPLSHQIIHVSLTEFSREDQVKVDIPVFGFGHKEDLTATLAQSLNHLKLRGQVAVLPERLDVDVSALGAGDSITAGQIALPEGVELLTPADTIVFHVTINRIGDLTTESETEAAEPIAEPAPAE